MSETWVFDFEQGDKGNKDLLGGKGANLANMTQLGLPVPPGFTITTRACNAYSRTSAFRGERQDFEIAPEELSALIETYKKVYKAHVGSDFPQDPFAQLRLAVEAVFKSWNNPRAKTYRRENNIPDSLGTACNVQSMVFGNMGMTSGTGVCFSRNPATGGKGVYGEFLINAQGEDVVAGIRTPENIEKLSAEMPEVAKQLFETID